jgi:hypothetical protein
MSMKVREIREWLDHLPGEDVDVGIDEGGLCLRAEGDTSNYLEIGGLKDGR